MQWNNIKDVILMTVNVHQVLFWKKKYFYYPSIIISFDMTEWFHQACF